MSKVAYNACYGGFSLSEQAMRRYCELKGLSIETRDWDLDGRDLTPLFGPIYTVGGKEYFNAGDIKDRHDPALVQAVEEFGAGASGKHSNILLRELPEGTRYRIDEYDGFESVMTVDEYEWSVA